MADPMRPAASKTASSGDLPAGGSAKVSDAAQRESSPAVQRIDRGHRQHAPRKPASSSVAGQPTAAPAMPPVDSKLVEQWPNSLLEEHAQDLVENLQTWASTLDRREAELNAILALQENRERSFRVWAQSQRQQLEDLERETERLKKELQLQVRRLAIASATEAVDSEIKPRH